MVNTDDFKQEDVVRAPKAELHLDSVIINQKKQLFLDVQQSKDVVIPNGQFQYQIYVKNISGTNVDNVHIYITNPYEININGASDTGDAFNIGNLKNGQSVLLNVDARASIKGYFYVNFITYGDNTEIKYKTLKVKCGYDQSIKNVNHKIHIYNFNPYENAYKLASGDFNDEVTQLLKIQSKPFKYKEQPFPLRTIDLDLHDQDIYLKNEDELPSMYLGRENFEYNVEEEYTGENFHDILEQINKQSKLINTSFLRTGNNEMELNFQQLYPNGLIHRFGLLKSEIYNRLGILPTFTSMNDSLFRWAGALSGLHQINNVDTYDVLDGLPEHKIDYWNEKEWCGKAYYVYETDNLDLTQSTHYKEVAIFETKRAAQSFIERTQEFNTFNHLTEYEYFIRPNYYTEGIFFVNLPLQDVPSNFPYMSNDTLMAIIENTKPYGMKAIPRYIINKNFSLNYEFNTLVTYNPHIQLDLPDTDSISFFIQSLKYHTQTDGSIKLVNDGKHVYQGSPLELDYRFKAFTPDVNVVSHDGVYGDQLAPGLSESNSLTHTETLKKVVFDLSNKDDFCKTLAHDNQNISFYKPTHMLNAPIDLYNTDVNLAIKEQTEPSSYYNCQIQTYDIIPDKYNFIKIKNQHKNHDNIEFGIAVNTSKNKKNLFSCEYLSSIDKYHITYKIITNNNIIDKKDAIIDNVESLTIELEEYNKQYLLVMYAENNNKFHYFTSVLLHDAMTFDVMLRNTQTIKEYINMDLSESLFIYNDNLNTILEDTKYSEYINIDDYRLLPAYKSQNQWQSLYRVNKNENSYAYIKNTNHQTMSVNDIKLFLNELNIPENSSIENILLKGYMSTNTNVDLKISTTSNINYAVDSENLSTDKQKYGIIIKPKGIDCYKKHNLLYYQYLLKNQQTDKLESLVNNLTETHSKLNKKYLQDNNIHFSKENPFEIKTSYWTEFDFSKDINLLANNAKSIKLVLKGYNNGSDAKVLGCLTTPEMSSTTITDTINTGYFYKTLELPLWKDYNLQELYAKIKFTNGGNATQLFDIQLFDVKIQINFTQYQSNTINYLNTQKQTIQSNDFFEFNLVSDVEQEYINNGFLTNIEFLNELNHGEYIKIYALSFEVIYKRNNTIVSLEPINQANMISATNDGLMNGLIFNEMISLEQLDYSERNPDKTYCKGIQLKESIYQSFIAQDDNITSIELRPNGYTGTPNQKIKLSLLTDNNKMPDKVIREVYIDGWRKENIYNETIKYNMYIDDLTINNRYWFKIEAIDIGQGSYWLQYNTSNIADYRLLYTDNGNVFNGESTLWFRIYCKNNTTNFKQFPVVSDNVQSGFTTILNLNDTEISDFKLLSNI